MLIYCPFNATNVQKNRNVFGSGVREKDGMENVSDWSNGPEQTRSKYHGRMHKKRTAEWSDALGILRVDFSKGA